jgi:RNA polymerase sigma-70 factor (ECF subfamily)
MSGGSPASAKGYGAAEKFFSTEVSTAGVFETRSIARWSIVDTTAVTRGCLMSSERHPRIAQLRLVGASSADETRKSGELDWSKLMARAQDGDRHAYRTLLQDVTPYLRSLAARCFKPPAEAEDAVQDVLLTVHMVRHAYDPGRPFGPWLVAIANRRFIDRLRRETRVKAREIALASEHETFPEPATNLDNEISEQAALNQAINTLPPEQRQAVTLLKLNEMSLKEAAAVSGRSIAALKVATHRAIKNLRIILKRQGD